MTAPNPIPRAELGQHEDPADSQQLYCAHRNDCMMVAGRGLWPALSCGQCNAYKDAPRDQRLQEHEDLTRFSGALVKIVRHAPVPRLVVRRRSRPL